jgi:hypothetical protein
MRAGFLVAAALAIAHAASAAEPVLKQLYPLGGQRGATVSVTMTGTADPWPPQVWADTPGLAFRAEPEKGKLTVEIAQDAALGPHLVRLFNAQGASSPRFFFVSAERELLEAEPNDDFKTPQKIEALPVTISGRLEKPGDVDSFAVLLKQGQPLTASLEAFVLGSPFDGMLRVIDATGIQLGFNHDGRTLDPLLCWTAPRDGTYVVQVMGFSYPPSSGVGFVGNENCLYRLHLSAEASLRASFPSTDVPEQAEAEPNDTAAQASTVAIPGAVTGVIQHPGDEDRFAFTAVKGASYEIGVLANRAGSPMNAWLKIESSEGKDLARVDGLGTARDPRLLWKAPADGRFIAAVGEATHRGSSEHVYRLTVKEAAPSIIGTAANHSLVLPADKGGELKVSVKRANGFKAAVQLVAKDLPDGVTAPELDVPEKDGDITLKFVVADGTARVSQPLRLVLREKESHTEHPVRYVLPASTGDKGDAATGPSDLVIDSTDVLWLTVPEKPAPPAAPKPEPPN